MYQKLGIQKQIFLSESVKLLASAYFVNERILLLMYINYLFGIRWAILRSTVKEYEIY